MQSVRDASGVQHLVAVLILVAVVAGVDLAAGETAPMVVYTRDNPPKTPRLEDLPLKQSVSQYDITWTFERPSRVGRFVNGDYYVVGAVTVAKIAPEPLWGDEVTGVTEREQENYEGRYARNGSTLNLPFNKKDESAYGGAGYDSRIPNQRYNSNLFTPLPIQMKPGDSLVSTISLETVGEMRRMLNPGQRTVSPVKTAAVLTCLAAPVPPDAFRPCYSDRRQKIYLARNLRRGLLPSLPPVANTPPLEEWERVFQRPWIDTVFFGFATPEENMPDYGRELGQAAGIGSLLLCLDFTPQEKERLLINFVQVGIDLWGLLRAGYPGWRAHGGHGSGRKLPIVFAGIMLGDEQMASPAKTFPDVKFGEDMQTMYGESWTGAKVVYAGHVGKDGEGAWGPYEHLHPSEWPGMTGEGYRRCCTSICWVGQALAMRILHAEDIWDHDAFFDYCDRWMTEDDTEHIEIIKKATDQDFSASYQRQRRTWYPFVDVMWATYRDDLPLARGVQDRGGR